MSTGEPGQTPAPALQGEVQPGRAEEGHPRLLQAARDQRRHLELTGGSLASPIAFFAR